MSVLTAEALLAGADATHHIEIPSHLAAECGLDPVDAAVVMRPLLLADVIRLQKATQHDEQLASVLMVQQALVEPTLTVEQVHRLPAGLVEHLLAEANRISGLTLTSDDLQSLVREPLARACLVLSREFGWTPETCAELTVAQLLLYLEMAERGDAA